MARKAIGPTGSRRRRWLFLLCLVVTVGAGVFFIPGALAVHDTGLFQLDGNASSTDLGSPASTGADDWDKVCHEVTGSDSDCSTTSDTSGATAVSWTSDGDLNATIFTGGGSKDPQDINNWAWKDGAGGLPDKDNLLHSYAARYSVDSNANCPGPGNDTTGATKCEVLFFGSDRYDNSGDAQQGFWFFQNKIGLGSNKVGGGTGFTSSGSGGTPPTWHRTGDILVISDFSNGGTTSTITVFKWDPACTATNKPDSDCADANLRTLETSTAANCATASPVDAFCGLVNGGTITMPWSFTDKSGTGSNGALNGEFYEGGINLSTLGVGDECFSSVASETRSSTSTTATLKDFVLGQFAPCGASLTTTPKGDTQLSGVGGSATVSDDATISVSGVSNPPAPTGSVHFYLCGPSATALTSCDSSGTDEGSVSLSGATQTDHTFTVNSGDKTLTASGYYCWFASWPGDSNYIPESPATEFSDGSSTECFSISQPTSVSTTLHETDSGGTDVSPPNNGTTITIDAGGYVTDYASVTPSSATGSVAFKYYGSSGDCTSDTNGTSAGGGTVSSGSATSSTVQFTTSGTYYWRAFFTGTGLSLNSSSDCSEILTVNLPTQVSTTLHETDSGGTDVSPPNNGTTITIDAGGYVTDYASVTPQDSYVGTVTGSVAFKYYGSSGDCTSDTNGTSAGGGTVSSGSATSSTVQFNDPGTYYWKAFFTGTGLSGNSESACNEILTVNSYNPSMTTAQTVTVTDSATITVGGGGALSGTAYFQPFSDSSCTAGSELATLDSVAVSGSSGTTVDSTKTVTLTDSGTVYWKVSYHSDNPAQTSIDPICSENTSVTIDNTNS